MLVGITMRIYAYCNFKLYFIASTTYFALKLATQSGKNNLDFLRMVCMHSMSKTRLNFP